MTVIGYYNQINDFPSKANSDKIAPEKDNMQEN